MLKLVLLCYDIYIVELFPIYLALKSNIPTLFRVKVPVPLFKRQYEGSSTFGEGL